MEIKMALDASSETSAGLLRGVSLPRVAVSLANFPKYLVSSPILCAWVARKVKNARSCFATSR